HSSGGNEAWGRDRAALDDADGGHRRALRLAPAEAERPCRPAASRRRLAARLARPGSRCDAVGARCAPGQLCAGRLRGYDTSLDKRCDAMTDKRAAEPSDLRVAIAGLGSIGTRIATALDQGIEGLTLSAVAVRDPAKHQAFLNSLRS